MDRLLGLTSCALMATSGALFAQTAPVVVEPTECPIECRQPIGGESDANRDAAPRPVGTLLDRFERERSNALNPYLFTAHKRNFILPVSFTSNLNEEPYEAVAPRFSEQLRNEEVQFQLSLKVRLNQDDLLFPNDGVYFGFTIASWWQLYSKDISAPFRETNYQPEFFYLNPLERRVFGGSVALALGFEHQSNGQVQALSRSWNRLYAGAIYGRGPFVAAVRTWYRLPEEEKEDPLDPRGDDNPDILDFYGYGELTLGWRGPRREYVLKAHGNPGTGKGGGEFAVSFPAFGRFRAVVSYFNGYGNSLIDYDHFQQRLGAGLLLSNLF